MRLNTDQAGGSTVPRGVDVERRRPGIRTTTMFLAWLKHSSVTVLADRTVAPFVEDQNEPRRITMFTGYVWRRMSIEVPNRDSI